MNPRPPHGAATGIVPAMPSDQTEASIAADVLVILLGDDLLPRRQATLTAARTRLGLTADEVRDAVLRSQARSEPRTFNRDPFPAAAPTLPPPAPAPPTEVVRPEVVPEPRRGVRPERPPRSARPLAGARIDLTRDGFYLPDGSYATLANATAAEHRRRAEWLVGAAAAAARFAAFHTECADLIDRAGVLCLGDLDPATHPALPTLDASGQITA